jgi:hypothetical protein
MVIEHAAAVDQHDRGNGEKQHGGLAPVPRVLCTAPAVQEDAADGERQRNDNLDGAAYWHAKHSS